MNRAPLILALLGLAGCTMGRSVGAVDGSTRPDASGPDAGVAPPEECLVRCGARRVCCAEGQECVAGACAPACDGSRCGADDALCCTGGELCIAGACHPPGGECIDDIDCASGEYCDLGLRRCLLDQSEECIWMPPPGIGDPEVVWRWEDDGVTATPLVVEIDDDGVADVVVSSFPGDLEAFTTPLPARLTALSGSDGTVLWQTPDRFGVCAYVTPALGDLDGDGRPEIVTLGAVDGPCQALVQVGGDPLHVLAFTQDGQPLWQSTFQLSTSEPHLDSVALADLDGDGRGEVIVHGAVLDHSGELLWSSDGLKGYNAGGAPFAMDVDDDPELEVIGQDGVWNHDGSERFRLGLPGDDPNKAFVVARVLPAEPGPQLIVVDPTDFWVFDAADGTELYHHVYETLEPGVDPGQTGTLVVADVDADGEAEVGVATEQRYVVFDPGCESDPACAEPPLVRWSFVNEDNSTGSVASTVFDFDGDGAAEVLYSDECFVRILRGTDGELLWHDSHFSGTIFEYPVVADVTGNGRANVVLASAGNRNGNLRGSCDSRSLPWAGPARGVTVYREARERWQWARPVWNQHAFHFDNVTDDGSLPAQPRQAWSSHDTFRSNRFPNQETVFLAPNLRVTSVEVEVPGACPADAILRARVQNFGARSVPPGVSVAFYSRTADGEPATLAAVGPTAELLPPGAAAWVEVTGAGAGIALGPRDSFELFATVDDDGAGAGTQNECDEDDNASVPVLVDCLFI